MSSRFFFFRNDDNLRVMRLNLNKSLISLALLAGMTLAQAADYRVSITANPTGWDAVQAAKGDLELFRKQGHTEAQLEESGAQLRTQYSRLSKAGTQAEGNVSIETVGDKVRFGGHLIWSHLDLRATSVEGEIHAQGALEIRRKRGDARLYVFDNLKSNTMMSPIDLAILAGDEALVATIKAEHEARMVIVDGQEVPLYRVDLTKDAAGKTVGYTIHQSAPTAFTSAALVNQDGTWRKENFKSDGKLERVTVVEPIHAEAFAFREIPSGISVADHRNHALGVVSYPWRGEVPAAGALASMRHRPAPLPMGLMILGLAVVGGGVWVLRGGRPKSS
jgi:hypothetical protein